MRILLTNHFPFHGSDTGPHLYALACGLRAAGHEVRALVVDCVGEGQEPFPVRRIVCNRNGDADLAFDFPCFVSHPRSRQTFQSLTDQQLDDYRNRLRTALDAEIGEFDPHVVHCQHVWILGHLALEAGVPYVLTAHGNELLAHGEDARYQRLTQEAAENAGRIICLTVSVQQWLEELLGDLEGRAVTMSVSEDDPAMIAWLSGVYSEVYERRFGRLEE